jgi:hypothetical protein
VDLAGNEFPGITLAAGADADGLFVGRPDLSVSSTDNNLNFFALDFFPTSGVACFSPDNYPSSGSPSPDGTLIVDFALPTNGVGAYFLDPEGFESYIEAFDGVGGSGNSLGKVIVTGYPDNAQVFAGIAATGIKSAVLVLGGGGDGVGMDDLSYGALGQAEVPLCAGQDEVIGSVSVVNDGANILTITYNTEGPWYIAETHLATDLPGIPTNKKGNPIPGHFPYSTDHDPLVQEVSYTVDASGSCPEIIIAAHAAVVGVTEEAPYAAGVVYDFDQGERKDGTAVLPARSTPTQALSYETGRNDSNFFSLGFTDSSGPGFIIVEFDCPIVNGDGDDLRIVEDTWDGVPGGTYPLEEAEIHVSQDAINWILLGTANNRNKQTAENAFNDFDLGSLEWIKYVKIVDVTDPSPHINSADAFDVNAVLSLQDCMDPETAWGDGCDGERFNEKTNWATYFTYDYLICAQSP